MKFLALGLLLLVCASTLSAQPVVTVYSLGTVVPNSGGINVAANSTFNSMGLQYEVTHPTNLDVGVTATVSNIGAAVNWTEATFNRASSAAPWNHDVTSPLGEFGPANTVHVVTLTFTDSASADTVISFSITAGATGPAQGGLPGDDGGACVVGAGGAPVVVIGLMLAAIATRRRRK
jgi:hypothetical protein